MQTEEIYRIVGGIVIALVILLGTLAAVVMLSMSPLWSNEGAAWVQAVGSIGAIVASLAIVRMSDGRVKRRNRENRMIMALASIAFLKESLDEFAVVVANQPAAGPVLMYHRRKSEIAMRKVESIQTEDLPLAAVRQIASIERVSSSFYCLLMAAPDETAQSQHHFHLSTTEYLKVIDAALVALRMEYRLLPGVEFDAPISAQSA
jgi:hypothetical protein